jgi:hypothetical protein
MTLSKIFRARQVEAENKMKTEATKLETKTLEEKILKVEIHKISKEKLMIVHV